MRMAFSHVRATLQQRHTCDKNADNNTSVILLSWESMPRKMLWKRITGKAGSV